MSGSVRVRVTPRSGKNEISGVREDGVILVRVTAPPEDGRANDAVCKLLANELGVPKSVVSVTRGQAGREKTVTIDSPATGQRELDALAVRFS